MARTPVGVTPAGESASTGSPTRNSRLQHQLSKLPPTGTQSTQAPLSGRVGQSLYTSQTNRE